MPHRAPLEIPVELGAALERRPPCVMAAAFGPVDQITAAFVCDGLAVVVERERRTQPAAVLADDADRQPAFVLDDVRDLRVDLPNGRGVAKDEIDLSIEVAASIQIAHPAGLFGANAEQRERREVSLTVIASEVRRGQIRRRDRAEWLPH